MVAYPISTSGTFVFSPGDLTASGNLVKFTAAGTAVYSGPGGGEGGASNGGNGGGGAAFSQVTRTVAADDTHQVIVGAAGVDDVGGNTSVKLDSGAGAFVLFAQGGGNEGSGLGGTALAGVGDTKHSGGNGGISTLGLLGGSGGFPGTADADGANGVDNAVTDEPPTDPPATPGKGGDGAPVGRTGQPGAAGQVVIVFTTAPTVTTGASSSVTAVTATCAGNVTSDGGATITERGIVYGTSVNPTTSDGKATAAGTTGAYTADLSSLLPSTTYHYRAYAINSEGTSYGSDSTFTTLAAGGSGPRQRGKAIPRFRGSIAVR